MSEQEVIQKHLVRYQKWLLEVEQEIARLSRSLILDTDNYASPVIRPQLADLSNEHTVLQIKIGTLHLLLDEIAKA